MSSSSDNTPQALKYPPVNVDHSISKLDLDTLMMKSTTLRETPGSSLDDSSYELLGLSDSLLEASDDEAHTASITSTDGPTPDDASDFSDDDIDYDSAHRDPDGTASAYQATHDEQHDPYAPYSTENSTHTEVPDHSSGEDAQRMKIRLEEQPAEEADFMQGSKIVRSFPDDTGAWFSVFDQYHCSAVRLVVKAALAKETLPTPDSYKILYFGKPDAWLERDVTLAITKALTACPSTSRSIMVQGQLEPFSPVVDGYYCTDVKLFPGHNGSQNITINLENHQKAFTFECGQVMASKHRPDLVVFIHPTISVSDTDRQDFSFARQVLSNEKVPCLDLIAARRYGHGLPSYDPNGLLVRVEVRKDVKKGFELEEVLPLDAYTFTELEPSQLNRHLALISPHMSTTYATTGKDSELLQHGSAWKRYTKLPMIKAAATKMFLMFFALTAILSLSILGSALMPLPLNYFGNDVQSPLSASVLTSSPPLVSEAVSSQPVVLQPSVPSIRSAPRELTLVSSQSKPAKRREGKQKQATDGVFKIERTGDHQFVLMPNQDFSNSRKKPQLQIQVTRESNAVPIRFNRTLSGVYVVDLEHQYPFGTFNVSIATFSKPLLRQSFDMMLGHNKSMFAQLFDSAKANLGTTQDMLICATGQLLANLTDLETTAQRWATKAVGLDGDTGERLSNAKDAFGRQVDVGTGIVKNVPRAILLGLRKVTAPVRTSTPVLRARTNALRVRCQMEMAAGLSSERIEGKRSWACSKIKGQS